MKMKTILLSIAALLLLSLSGCQKTYDDPAPYPRVDTALMKANKSIMEFKAMYSGEATKIPTYDTTIIVGKVISTDRYGNFYRLFYIQDTTANGGGIDVKIGLTGLYNDYKIGQLVYIKPVGLCLGKYGEMISLGLYTTTRYQTAYIDVPAIIQATIFRGELSTPIIPMNITSSADINDARYGTLVTLKNATYNGSGTSGLKTWARPANPDLEEDANYGEQNFLLEDGVTNIVVRTSGYSRFAGTTVPFAVGQKVNVTGVLTRFNTTIQLMLNTDTDAVAVP